jgi:NADH-quinone oxidoreductase subunit M
MINHGLSTGALFLLVGMIYERRHTREMDAFGGLMEGYACLCGTFMLIVSALIDGIARLEWFCGRVHDTAWCIWFGGYRVSTGLLDLAALGMILAAVYMLFMYQKMFLGPVDKEENRFCWI